MSDEMVKANNGNGNPAAGMTVRQEFGAEQTTVHADMRSAALAAQETAKIQARYIVAMQRPRDFEGVRVRVLAHCNRPNFAKCARYAKPMGSEKDENGRWVKKFVRGPSVRFVETALQEMSNIDQEVVVIAESATLRIVRVSVTDSERNTSSSLEVPVAKTVERSSVRDGRIPISERKNSRGEVTYLLPATEDEMRAKVASEVSRALRNVGLRVIPGDIVEEAMERVIEVQSKEDAKDPTAARKQLVEWLSKRGVQPEDIAQYLGRTVDKATSAELHDLRAIGMSINDGETTWEAVMQERFDKAGDGETTGAPARGVAAMKEKLAAKTAAEQPASAPASTPPTAAGPTAGPPAPPPERKRTREPGEEG